MASKSARDPSVTPCILTCRITTSGSGMSEAAAPATTPIMASVPPDPDSPDRLRQRARSPDLDDQVSPATVREGLHGPGPVRLGSVVDQVIGPERLSSGELGILRGGQDHGCAEQLGELKGKER